MLTPGSLMLVLCVQVGLVGVLMGLPGTFMPGQVIFFSVVLGAATMGMGGKIMVLGSNLLRFAHEVARARIVPSAAPGPAKTCKASQFGRIGKSGIPSAVFALLSAEFPLTHAGSAMDHPVLQAIGSLYGRRDGMTMAPDEMSVVKEILVRREAELGRVLRNRDGIAIEKSADQMDEIQYASERDLAIRNVDRDSILLRHVRAALRRVHDGSFGTCIDCEWEISPKRLAAVPWASRCIKCQEAADRDGLERGGESETLVNAA